MDKCSQIEMHRKKNSMRRCGPIISALNSLRPPETWAQATQRYCNGLQEMTHAKESRFRNMGNFLLVESGTVGFEIQNSAQGNPESHWRGRPESKFHWQRTGIIGNRNKLEGIFRPFLFHQTPIRWHFLLFLWPLTVRCNFAESGARPGLNFDLREIGGDEKATTVHMR